MHRSLALPATLLLLLSACGDRQCAATAPDTTPRVPVEFLEIVTRDVDATCTLLAAQHGVAFGEPVPHFGNARTAALSGGGRISVRAPMRETETPVVRPYLLVEDAAKAVEAAREAGAQIALPPMEIPNEGTFAIYILGGIEHGVWQK